MDLFTRTKAVRATPMKRLDYNLMRGWELPQDEDGSDEGFLVEDMGPSKPNHKDYKGYISWMPADSFTLVHEPVQQMDFGGALDALKNNNKVARAGWNGQGMFVYLVPAAKYAAQTGAAKDHFGEEAFVPYNAYLALKGVDETVSTWVPSVTDVLAEDWSIIP